MADIVLSSKSPSFLVCAGYKNLNLQCTSLTESHIVITSQSCSLGILYLFGITMVILNDINVKNNSMLTIAD